MYTYTGYPENNVKYLKDDDIHQDQKLLIIKTIV